MTDTKDLRRVRPSINKIADEDELAAIKRRNTNRVISLFKPVPQGLQKRLQFVGAAMNVADYIERSCIPAAIRP
jgi:hypothetical protein